MDIWQISSWGQLPELISDQTKSQIKGWVTNDKTKYFLGAFASLAASCGIAYYLYQRELVLDQTQLRQKVIELSTFHLEIQRAKLIRLTSCLDNIHLSSSQLADVHFMFSCAVSDRSGGVLTMHDFHHLMESLELNSLPGKIQFQFRLMDQKHHGAVNFLEFAEFIQWLHSGTKEEVLFRIFSTADIHQTGYVSTHDLYWAINFTNPVANPEADEDIVSTQNWERIHKHLRLYSGGGGEQSHSPISLQQWLTLAYEPDIFSFSIFNQFARQTSALFGSLPTRDSTLLPSRPHSPNTSSMQIP